MKRCTLMFLMAGLLHGAQPVNHWRKAYLIASSVHVAGTVADAASSWGIREANPVLRGSNGQFGAKGAAVKAAICGASIGVGYLLLQKWPNSRVARALTVVHVGIGVVYGASAYRNFNLRGE